MSEKECLQQKVNNIFLSFVINKMDKQTEKHVIIGFIVVLSLVAVGLLIWYFVDQSKHHGKSGGSPGSPGSPSPQGGKNKSPGINKAEQEICNKLNISTSNCNFNSILNQLQSKFGGELEDLISKIKKSCPNLNNQILAILLEILNKPDNTPTKIATIMKDLKKACTSAGGSPGSGPGNSMMLNKGNTQEMYSNNSCGCGC